MDVACDILISNIIFLNHILILLFIFEYWDLLFTSNDISGGVSF